MRTDPGDDLAAVARRRLEALGRELARAGADVPTVDPERVDPETDFETDSQTSSGAAGAGPDDAPAVIPAVVPEPGRHARPRAGGRGAGIVALLQGRLPATVAERWQLRTRHVALLAVLLAAGLAGTAWWTLRAAPQPVPVAHLSPAAGSSAAAAAPVPSAAPSVAPSVASSGASSRGPVGEVVVDVAGKVRRPGVATLPAGSRVIDALERAGGARAGVDLSSLNLARVLVDGEQILVGVAPAPGVAVPSAAPGAGALVNLNTGTLEQLDTLPGVGPVTAQKILAWRTEHGAFTSIDELLEVDGIGAKTYEEIAPHVTL